MPDTELVRIRFDGGLATHGQLHFYEYSRSQYALARFVATVEHFRRTGKIAERITLESNVEILVRTPQEGSFIEEIIVPALKEGIGTVISTPLSALISYAWHLIIPRTQKTDDLATELAKIRLAEQKAVLARERERTKQEAERTKQIKALTDLVEGERSTTRQALELVAWAQRTRNTAVARLGVTREEFKAAEAELTAEAEREAEFERYRDELTGIEESVTNRLTSRLRPMISEIGLPLRRSADRVSIGGAAKKSVYAELTPDVIRDIQDKQTEEQLVAIIGRVKSYDRDAGVGKVTSAELPRKLNFVVPLGERHRLISKILDAMRRDSVILTCRRVIDRSGQPTSLILIDINLPQGV